MTGQDHRQYRQRDDNLRRRDRSLSPRGRLPNAKNAPSEPPSDSEYFEDEHPRALLKQPCPWCMRDNAKKHMAHTHRLADCGHYKRSTVSIRKEFVRKLDRKITEEEQNKKERLVAESKKKEQAEAILNQALAANRTQVAEASTADGMQQLHGALKVLSSTLSGESQLEMAQSLQNRWQHTVHRRRDFATVPAVEVILREALQMWIEKYE